MSDVSSASSSDNRFGSDCAGHPAGSGDEAVRRLLQASALDTVSALLVLGTTLYQNGKFGESASCLRRAAELQPKSIGALSRLGSAYMACRDYARATECFTRCVELDPGCAQAHYWLGNACRENREHEQAILHYQQALKLDPGNYLPWKNLGSSLRELNQLEQALAAYDRALALHPKSELTRCCRAVALLVAGRLEEGLSEYEWRWGRDGQIAPSRSYPQPVWNGDPLPENTLFIHAEQGYGDMIQFVRFVREARRRVARVILECQAPLQSLFAGSDCADLVIPVDEPPPPFDAYIPIMSLPKVLGIDWATVSTDIPYLAAPLDGNLPAVPPEYLKVGVAWAGNPKHEKDALRSMRLEELAPILQCPGITFFSLQAMIPARDQTCFGSFPNLIDISAVLTDFKSTASIIQQMDLVISVDTAVAHLAGVLGKPTWTFIQHTPDWRWLLDQANTPWYPTMRLFRQQQKAKWEAAISLVAAELARLLES